MNRERLEDRLRAAFDRDVDSGRPAESLIDGVMPRLEETGRQEPWRRFVPRPRVAWALLPVGIGLIAALFVWQPWNSNGAQSAVARAQATMANLQYYRVSLVAREGSGQSPTLALNMEFSAPDRYHEIYTADGGHTEEFVLIGDLVYGKGMDVSSTGSSTGVIARRTAFSSLLGGDAVTKMFGYLKDVEKLPDETVDGALCVHSRGAVDFERQYRAAIQEMQESNASKGLPPLSQETQDQMMKEARSIRGSRVVDVWIGKSDYLMRRMRLDAHGPDPKDLTQSLVVDFQFYDFNQPIVIEPPLGADGQLLPGWSSASR